MFSYCWQDFCFEALRAVRLAAQSGFSGDSSIVATKMGHGPILFWKHVNYAILIIPEGAVKDQDDFSNGFAKSVPSGRNTSFSMSLSASDFPDITLFLLHFVKEI